MFTSLFDGVADLVGALLTACFGLVPSLPLALVLTSAVGALALAPLTVRSVRLARVHARLEPRLRALRAEHADDPAALRDATMALFREAGTSPLTPLLLGLAQAPLPLILLRTVRGLIHHGPAGVLAPRHVGGALAQSVRSGGVTFAGIDLTTSGLAALHGPPLAGIVVGLFASVILLVALAQGRLGRRSARAAQTPPMLRLASKVGPVFALVWGMLLPVAVVVSLTTMAGVRVAVLWLVERRPPTA
jgi:YidC/Oxa1 family membrane protein insertase